MDFNKLLSTNVILVDYKFYHIKKITGYASLEASRVKWRHFESCHFNPFPFNSSHLDIAPGGVEAKFNVRYHKFYFH